MSPLLTGRFCVPNATVIALRGGGGMRSRRFPRFCMEKGAKRARSCPRNFICHPINRRRPASSRSTVCYRRQRRQMSAAGTTKGRRRHAGTWRDMTEQRDVAAAAEGHTRRRLLHDGRLATERVVRFVRPARSSFAAAAAANDGLVQP
jgi:hypothetical protein